MRTSSLRRYLIVELALPAFVVNALFNALLGRLFHPSAGPVSRGAIVVDTLVDAAFVAFFTLFVVGFGARRAARAGRLRGWNHPARWLGAPARRPLLWAGGLALASVIVLGLPAVAALAAAGTDSMSRAAFIGFKAAFAGATAVITGVAVALVAIAPEADVSTDDRWWRDDGKPQTGVVYPCDHLDKGGLVVTDRDRGCSGTPTWQLIVSGALDPTHVRTALADVVARYPALTTKVQALDGAPQAATRFRWAHDRSFALDAIFEVVNLRGRPEALDPLIQAHRNRHLDLFRDFPLTLTMVLTADDGCRLLFRQHHALADGRAFFGLLVDFAAFLEAARAGRRPTAAALAPIGRRPELDALGLGRARRWAWTIAGHFILFRHLIGAVRRPLAPLVQNRSNDYTGPNGTVHWIVDDSVLVSWNAARKRIGCSLNSLLTAALFVANERFGRAQAVPAGRTVAQLILETRPREGEFVSFANHLAMLWAEIDLGRGDGLDVIARAVQAQVEEQRRSHRPIKRLLAERQFVRMMTLGELKPIVFETEFPAFQLDFSNLIALPLADLGGDGWRVDDVLVTTPVGPRTGITLTAIRYRGRLVFNFNFKSSAASREQTEALCHEFQEALRAL